MDDYDGDIENGDEAEPIDMEDGTKAKSKENDQEAKGEVERDDVEVEDEEVEVAKANDIDYDDYPYGQPSDWSYIANVNSRSGP